MAELNEVEQDFRNTLGDMMVFLEKMMPKCGSIEELAGMVELSLKNDSQLRMLLKEVAPRNWGK